jgi:hypothetical protein
METDIKQKRTWKRKRTWKQKRTWKRKRKLPIHEHGHGHGNGHGHGISELLLSISYSAIVPIAPYGIPLKYHGAISYRCWNNFPNDVLAELEISV